MKTDCVVSAGTTVFSQISVPGRLSKWILELVGPNLSRRFTALDGRPSEIELGSYNNNGTDMRILKRLII